MTETIVVSGGGRAYDAPLEMDLRLTKPGSSGPRLLILGLRWFDSDACSVGTVGSQLDEKKDLEKKSNKLDKFR